MVTGAPTLSFYLCCSIVPAPPDSWNYCVSAVQFMLSLSHPPYLSQNLADEQAEGISESPGPSAARVLGSPMEELWTGNLC